jgi:hypothetical protein
MDASPLCSKALPLRIVPTIFAAASAACESSNHYTFASGEA